MASFFQFEKTFSMDEVFKILYSGFSRNDILNNLFVAGIIDSNIRPFQQAVVTGYSQVDCRPRQFQRGRFDKVILATRKVIEKCLSKLLTEHTKFKPIKNNYL